MYLSDIFLEDLHLDLALHLHMRENSYAGPNGSYAKQYFGDVSLSDLVRRVISTRPSSAHQMRLWPLDAAMLLRFRSPTVHGRCTRPVRGYPIDRRLARAIDCTPFSRTCMPLADRVGALVSMLSDMATASPPRRNE